MALNEKKLQRLDQLLSAFDTGAVQPDELIKAIDAVIAIIDQNGKTLVDKIVENKAASDEGISNLRADLKQVRTNLQGVISDVKLSSESNVDKVRASLLTEIKRVESLIPELPPETDLSEVFNEIESQKAQLANLGILIVGENIRNALESLQGEERLDISAIKGVDELIDRIEKIPQGQSYGGVRLLSALLDVNTSGITNGQTLVWNSTTERFEPGAGGSGSGIVETIVAGTGISVDDTDPANPIVTADGGGDVTGPASATDNAIARYDGTTGKLLKDSLVTISDTGGLSVADDFSISDFIETDLAAGKGKIIIGNSGPAALRATFEVNENISGGEAKQYLFVAGTGDTIRFAIRKNGRIDLTSSIILLGGSGIQFSGSNTRIDGAASGPISLHTGDGTMRMHIGSTGNVGIGNGDAATILDVSGAFTQRPLSADPSDPADGNSVTWVSDGTGSGDVGDIMCKVNVGGTVKLVTLIDFSAA